MHEQRGGTDSVDAGRAREATGIHQSLEVATVLLQGDFHKCDQFSCAKSERVTRFLREDRHKLAGPLLANIYVLEDPADKARILGYYSLSAGQIERDWLSNRVAKQLPRRIAPMALLGFMGRDDGAQQGLGALLLADAAIRASQGPLAVWGMMLHAENEQLSKWYEKRGFRLTPQELVGEHNKLLMYAPMKALLPQA
jgi:hypothetical protein